MRERVNVSYVVLRPLGVRVNVSNVVIRAQERENGGVRVNVVNAGDAGSEEEG